MDDTLTGEVLLDEALKMMKQEKMSISDWIDLMSGRSLQYKIPTMPDIAGLHKTGKLTMTRRDMEPFQDGLPAKTSP